MKMIELNHGEKFRSPYFPNSILMKMKNAQCRGHLVNSVDMETGEQVWVETSTEITKLDFKFEAKSKKGDFHRFSR